MKKWYVFECSDGSKWRVPTEVIAKHRSAYYVKTYAKFQNDLEKHMKEHTIPLFESDDYEIEDWARNNMDWTEVENFAERLNDGGFDMQEEWVNPEETDVTD